MLPSITSQRYRTRRAAASGVTGRLLLSWRLWVLKLRPEEAIGVDLLDLVRRCQGGRVYRQEYVTRLRQVVATAEEK